MRFIVVCLGLFSLLPSWALANNPPEIHRSPGLGVYTLAYGNEGNDWCGQYITLGLFIAESSPLRGQSMNTYFTELAPVLSEKCPAAEQAEVMFFNDSKADDGDMIGPSLIVQKATGWLSDMAPVIGAMPKAGSGQATPFSYPQTAAVINNVVSERKQEEVTPPVANSTPVETTPPAAPPTTEVSVTPQITGTDEGAIIQVTSMRDFLPHLVLMYDVGRGKTKRYFGSLYEDMAILYDCPRFHATLKNARNRADFVDEMKVLAEQYRRTARSTSYRLSFSSDFDPKGATPFAPLAGKTLSFSAVDSFNNDQAGLFCRAQLQAYAIPEKIELTMPDAEFFNPQPSPAPPEWGTSGPHTIEMVITIVPPQSDEGPFPIVPVSGVIKTPNGEKIADIPEKAVKAGLEKLNQLKEENEKIRKIEAEEKAKQDADREKNVESCKAVALDWAAGREFFDLFPRYNLADRIALSNKMVDWSAEVNKCMTESQRFFRQKDCSLAALVGDTRVKRESLAGVALAAVLTQKDQENFGTLVHVKSVKDGLAKVDWPSAAELSGAIDTLKPGHLHMVFGNVDAARSRADVGSLPVPHINVLLTGGCAEPDCSNLDTAQGFARAITNDPNWTADQPACLKQFTQGDQ